MQSAKIVMFGDSLTARGNWKELLGRDDVANLGVDGDTIRGATNRVHQVTRLSPEIIVVMLGINDLISGRPAVSCEKDMRRLRDRLRAGAPSARIVVASVLPVGDSFRRLTPQIDDLNSRLRALCADRSCTFLDVAAGFADEPDALDRDDLHLADAGYQRWAAVLRPTLDDA